MRDLAIKVNGIRYKAKRLDSEFADFVEKEMKESGISFDAENSAEKLFAAYLRLAGKSYNYEKEIEDIIREIEE